jgi:hypothetical protein
MNQADWQPNSLERTCLSHLDSPENWENILKRPIPPQTQILPWTPFLKIFAFNLLLFTVVLGALLTVILVGTSGPQSLSEDLPIFIGFVLTSASFVAAYSTHLYRRSWNRRAKSLNN